MTENSRGPYIRYRDVNGLAFHRDADFNEGVQDATILHLYLDKTRKGARALIAYLGILGPEGGVTVRQTVELTQTARVREVIRALQPEWGNAVLNCLADHRLDLENLSINEVLSYFNGGHTSVTVDVGAWYHKNDEEQNNRLPNIAKWLPESARKLVTRPRVASESRENPRDEYEYEYERDLEPVN